MSSQCHSNSWKNISEYWPFKWQRCYPGAAYSGGRFIMHLWCASLTAGLYWHHRGAFFPVASFFSWSQKSTNFCCLCVILGYEDLDNLSAAWCYLELGVSSLSDRHTTYCLKCVTHGCKRSTKPPPPQDTSLFKDLERTPPTCPLFKGIKWICIHLPTANHWMLHVCIRTLLESDQSETSSCF